MARTKQTARKDAGGKTISDGKRKGQPEEEEPYARGESGQEGGAGILL